MPKTREYDAAPPQGQGYYDRKTGMWWDQDLARFLPVGPGVDVLEVRVEKVSDDGHPGLRLPLVDILFKAPRYRFVADATSADTRWPTYCIVGEPFSISRPRILGGRIDAHPWAAIPQRHLSEFVARLFEHGWQPSSHGDHWWSLNLVRPCVQWPADVVTETRTALRTAA